MDVLQAVLLDAGSPVLLAPAGAPGDLGGTVVIAWKDTQQAARAVAAAMPFIERAGRVVIVSAGESEADDDPTAHKVQRWLRWHNANTSVQLVAMDGRSAVEALLDEAGRLEAGLLVMGGYSHSQWREAVFGGVTDQVLRNAELAVLMAH